MCKKINIKSLFIGLVALIAFSTANYASAAGPIKNKSYQDFNAWFIKTYKLKSQPYRAATIIDAKTGTPLFFYNEKLVMPTASLVKLFTAATVMSYKPMSWSAAINFNEDENENLLRPYVDKNEKLVILKLKAGDTITFKQALSLMLVGSVNNAAASMPRLVGVTAFDFVSAMRQQAKKWGLENTAIDEPSGLSLNNTSTAEDLAKAGCAAFSNPTISKMAASPAIKLTTTLGEEKNIKHTLYQVRSYPQRFWGAKTGYLNETKYHAVVGLITPQGRKICVSVLSSDTRAQMESTLWPMALWVDKMYK